MLLKTSLILFFIKKFDNLKCSSNKLDWIFFLKEFTPKYIFFTLIFAIIEGTIPTLENTENLPPISFSWSRIKQLFWMPIFFKGLGLFSVIIKQFLKKVSKIFFWSAIVNKQVNWLSVSGVDPDFEIMINPVSLIFIFLNSFWKLTGFILS